MALMRFVRPRAVCLVPLLLLAAGVSAWAQTVDPHTAEFDPSADHYNTTPTGQPMVTRYDLEFYNVGATSPFMTADLGKPDPQGDGKIRVDLATAMVALPPPGVVYEARVSAVGPGGSAASALSNQFMFSVPCAYAISPTSKSLAAAGGSNSVSVSVTSGSGCAWTAVSNVSWLTITSGASGTGNGTVSYTAAANSSTSPRTGTMTIAGQTFTVTQAGITCSYSLSPTSASAGDTGGANSVAVTAPAGCSWTASSNDAWLTVTAGASGSGAGTVSYSVAANSSISSRSGTLTIGGQTFTVTQAGITCSYSLSPTSASAGDTGGANSVAVTAPAGCSWTASSNDAWLTVTAGASGSGAGTVSYGVAANSSISSRSGTLTIGGQTFTVTQAGITCSYSLSPTSASAGDTGGANSVAVTAPAGCSWTASSNDAWLTVTAGASGSGDGTVSYGVAANSSISSRSGTMTIGGQTFTVTQAGITCSYSLSPTSASAGDTGGANSVAVTAPAGCSWTASSNDAWLTVTAGASGSGAGTVSYSVAANSSISSRSGTMTIGGQTFTVTQAGITCSYSLSPTSASLTAAGGPGTVAVTAPVGCSWTAASQVSWISVTDASGSGPGSFSYSAEGQGATTSRTGTITLGGQTFTLIESGITGPAPPGGLHIVR